MIYEVSEEDYLKAVSVTEDKRVGVNDALAYVLMKKVGPRKIYSFDKDFETFEEFELGKSPDIYKILFLSLNKLNVKWYFGLYTGLRLNGLTHKFFDTIFVLNDQIYRPKEIKIAGEKVKFLKLSSKLVDFGIVNESDKRFSDVEKTLLDLIYISRYRSVPEGRIFSMIGDYGKKVRIDRVLEYLRFYPKAVKKVVKAAGLI